MDISCSSSILCFAISRRLFGWADGDEENVEAPPWSRRQGPPPHHDYMIPTYGKGGGNGIALSEVDRSVSSGLRRRKRKKVGMKWVRSRSSSRHSG